MAQGTPLEIAEKTSEKTGSRYYSINLGTLDTPRPASKGFYNDPLPAAWKDGHTA